MPHWSRPLHFRATATTIPGMMLKGRWAVPWLGAGLLISLLAAMALSQSAPAAPTTRPTVFPATARSGPMVFVIGDSTVKNHGILVGWGEVIGDYFDARQIGVENDAVPGRSSRTFVDEGKWAAVRSKLRKGDFVLMQFGHNDSKQALSMDRYSLPGLGEETEQGVNSKTHQPVTIHTFGFYMRLMISEAKAAGATPIVFSPVPRCKWEDGKLAREEAGTGEWARETAAALNVSFVDLNT